MVINWDRLVDCTNNLWPFVNNFISRLGLLSIFPCKDHIWHFEFTSVFCNNFTWVCHLVIIYHYPIPFNIHTSQSIVICFTPHHTIICLTIICHVTLIVITSHTILNSHISAWWGVKESNTAYSICFQISNMPKRTFFFSNTFVTHITHRHSHYPSLTLQSLTINIELSETFADQVNFM